MSVNLNPEKALIFRIVHMANVPWILDHGLHCRNSPDQDPDFVDIGNADPGKQVRYQAEALVHRHVPLQALLGIGCHDGQVSERLQSMVETRGLSISVRATPIWYF